MFLTQKVDIAHFSSYFYAFKLDTLCSDPQTRWEQAMIINFNPLHSEVIVSALKA